MATRFTAPGGTYLRVETRLVCLTDDRDEAELSVDTAALGMFAIQRSADLAQDGEFLQARLKLISTQRLLQRAMKSRKDQKAYINFIVLAERLDGFMRIAQQQGMLERKAKLDDTAARNIMQMRNVCKQALL